MQQNTNHTTKNLPSLRKVLVIGNGGRENALAWAIRKCPGIEEVTVTPGNGGTEDLKGCNRLNIPTTKHLDLIDYCLNNKIDLIVVGPEAPLAEGIADTLREHGLVVFGPGANGAKLEASKKWSKSLMKEAGIPTANHWNAQNKKEALEILERIKLPLVVKADGLAAGKGVTVPNSIDETVIAIKESFEGKFGSAGNQIVLEEKLEGPEVSIFALSDGNNFILLPPAQDHKRLKEGDLGPNTGGMGAYSPTLLISQKDLDEISDLVIKPTLEALNNKNIDYRGVIYAGLMLTSQGPKVIEFNCRFGDPECQALMPLMGPEFAQLLFACALGSISMAPTLSVSKNCSACVVAAASGYPEDPRKGDLIKIFLEENSSLRVFQAGTELDSQGNLLTNGGRVLSVVGEGENFDKAFKRVYAGIKQIDFPGINYRKDIGHQVRKS